MTTLDRWIEAACAKLGVEPDTVDQRLILGLAREAAHQVDRPAAPLTAFLLGLAVGRGAHVDEANEQLKALIDAWPPA